MNWGRNIFIVQLGLAVFQTIHYYPLMPATIASHFDSSGIPNGWAGKFSFFALYLSILFFLGIVFLYLPKRSVKRSQFGMNLPNRDYWLAPDHIEQTRQFLMRQMLIMGNVHVLLALTVIQLVIMANFIPDPVLDTRIFWVLIIYFIFLPAWLINFFLHFRKPG